MARLDDYSWVLAGWHPQGVTVHTVWFGLIAHNGLPYVQFDADTDRGYVSVRCDPCSLDQDRTAYAAMVRADLEKALGKLAEATLFQ